MAAETGRSRATVCTLCRRGHERLAANGPLPTVTIMAAQSHRGLANAFGRVGLRQRGDERMVWIATSRVTAEVLPALTRAEKDVAQLLVDGRSKDEIATLRSTARHTVTTQAHAIFAKTGATGRYALIRKIVALMWPPH